jgi:hypothetical protein
MALKQPMRKVPFTFPDPAKAIKALTRALFAGGYNAWSTVGAPGKSTDHWVNIFQKLLTTVEPNEGVDLWVVYEAEDLPAFKDITENRKNIDHYGYVVLLDR